MQRAVKSNAALIQLDTNSGSADMHDRDFTSY
jgi:hypothetical protein